MNKKLFFVLVLVVVVDARRDVAYPQRHAGPLVFTVGLLAGTAAPRRILVAAQGLFSASTFKDRERGRRRERERSSVSIVN